MNSNLSLPQQLKYQSPIATKVLVLEANPINHNTTATMGIELDIQMLDTENRKVKSQIWDTAVQERFVRVLLPTYFCKTKGVILVDDVTNTKSFESPSKG